MRFAIAALAAVGAAPLPATPLAGPYATIDAACAAALAASGTPARPCVSKPLRLNGAPVTAALLRAEDPSDPRFAGSGVFFFAYRSEGTWFVATKPLDRMNGAAGHTYLPEITFSGARSVAARVLLRFADVTSRVCNACERHTRELVQTRAIVLVCGRDRANAIACTAPLEIDARARAELAPDGTLAITAPGAAPQRYDVIF
jgi:hypothetical protein